MVTLSLPLAEQEEGRKRKRNAVKLPLPLPRPRVLRETPQLWSTGRLTHNRDWFEVKVQLTGTPCPWRSFLFKVTSTLAGV